MVKCAACNALATNVSCCDTRCRASFDALNITVRWHDDRLVVFCGCLLWVCQAGSLSLRFNTWRSKRVQTTPPHHFPLSKWGLNGFYKWELLSETGMILQVGFFQPRKHQLKDCSFKTPKLPDLNSMVSRKLNGSLNGPATVHYCRSGLSTKFFLVERLFTPNKILVPRLSYSPIVYICFFCWHT